VSFTGTLTNPKLIDPVQMGRGILEVYGQVAA
jgi:hypothetical protein